MASRTASARLSGGVLLVAPFVVPRLQAIPRTRSTGSAMRIRERIQGGPLILLTFLVQRGLPSPNRIGGDTGAQQSTCRE